jgi:hypothetical protein
MARRPDPAVRSRWQRLIDAQHQSGLTVTEFCDRNHVSTASFYLWRKRLSQQPDTPAFVTLDVTDDATSPSLIRVRFDCGAVLEIPPSQIDALTAVAGNLAALGQGAAS